MEGLIRPDMAAACCERLLGLAACSIPAHAHAAGHEHILRLSVSRWSDPSCSAGMSQHGFLLKNTLHGLKASQPKLRHIRGRCRWLCKLAHQDRPVHIIRHLQAAHLYAVQAEAAGFPAEGAAGVS